MAVYILWWIMCCKLKLQYCWSIGKCQSEILLIVQYRNSRMKSAYLSPTNMMFTAFCSFNQQVDNGHIVEFFTLLYFLINEVFVCIDKIFSDQEDVCNVEVLLLQVKVFREWELERVNIQKYFVFKFMTSTTLRFRVHWAMTGSCPSTVSQMLL